MKHFRDGNRMIETRLLMQHQDGEWSGWSYRWNDAQTDAELLTDGDVRSLQNGVKWSYPDRGDCLHCHTRPTLRTIGLEVAQLNRNKLLSGNSAVGQSTVDTCCGGRFAKSACLVIRPLCRRSLRPQIKARPLRRERGPTCTETAHFVTSPAGAATAALITA